MTELKLRKLTLKNFKGIKDREVEFGEFTNIFGANETGKSTLIDAFTWVFFGKNAENKTDFSVKPLDKYKKEIHGLETTVIAEVEINGRPKTFQKTLREKWTKKRGEAEKTLTGHETLCKIDGDEVGNGEYQKIIAALLDEKIFKIITNPFHFSKVLSWVERKQILLSLVGDVSNEELYAEDRELEILQEYFDAGKTEFDIKKSLSVKKKNLNAELKLIPARIDEVQKQIVEIDEEELRRELEAVEKRLADNNSAELDALYKRFNILKNQAVSERAEKLNQLMSELRNAKSDLAKKELNVQDLRNQIETLNSQKERYEAERKEKVEEFEAEKDKVFSPEITEYCQLCGQKLPEEKIREERESQEENFNKEKVRKLKEIQERGLGLKSLIDDVKKTVIKKEEELQKEESLIEQLRKYVEDKEAEVEKFEETEIVYDPEYEMLKLKIKEIEDSAEADDKKELAKKRDEILAELEKIKNNEKLGERIAELMREEREISEKIAKIEKVLFALEKYTKLKIEKLTAKIDSKFSIVSFKMFNELINGAIEETCVATVDGVPFPDLNTAKKYSAGIDIINALTEHFQMSAPIFIDDREHVTNLLPPKASQLINLFVSPEDKEIRVETNDKKVA